ncbi:Uncharacterised protein [Escherichia coli]|uniref:Uncharacterized protein n=1 Tax=Escherichia coli TaxID=562 RepID=A0A377D971_ECOLX|nr:Uncharacterised protein [Escherichia coli]
MFTFIELQGLANAASYCYLMMSSGFFRNYSFKIPLPVTLSQAQAVLEKFAGTVLEWGNGVAFG